MQSYTRLASRLSEEEVRRGVEQLAPWFYPFDLGDGLRTVSAVPPEVEGIFATRQEMMERAVRAHFGEHLGAVDCLDIGCHEGFYSLALARMGAKSVTGLEPREESLRRAEFILAATGVSNLEFRIGQVETLAAEQKVYPLTLFLGVLYHVMDPMLCLRNVGAATGELCVIETQVVDEVEGITEWGARAWTRPYQGILALIDESGEYKDGNRETGITPLVSCPSPRALEAMLHHAGFRKVEFIRPADGAYEQHARGKRVVVAACK